MASGPSLSVAERIFGLSQIWASAHYNFAFFDRIPDLDWDAAYLDSLPRSLPLVPGDRAPRACRAYRRGRHW